MKNKFLMVVGMVAAILIAAFFYNKYRMAPPIKFDSLSLTDLNGTPVSLDSFHNKKFLINFFATWCGPCLQEFPSLVNAQSILENENFQFIIISDEPVSRLQSFEKETNIPFMILHSEKKISEYGVLTIPTSYVLNEKKEIVYTKVGVINWASNNMIEKLRSASN